MAKKKRAQKTTKIDPRKAVATIRAIHDVLYLEASANGEFHNGAKEWSVDMLEAIAGAVGLLVSRPPAAEACEECGNAIPSIDGGGLSNRHHDPSCSLHDPSRD